MNANCGGESAKGHLPIRDLPPEPVAEVPIHKASIDHYKSQIITLYHNRQSAAGRHNEKMEKDANHQGRWLRGKVERSGRSNAAFAREAGISREVLQRWYNAPELRMRPAQMWRVIDGLGLSALAEIMGNIRNTAERDPLVEHSISKSIFGTLMELDRRGQLTREGAMQAKKEFDSAVFDRNVEPYSEVAVPPIPLFDLPLAAGDWTDVTVMGEVCDPRVMRDGRFRVRLRGDSMTPKYKDGEVVEFQCMNPEVEGPVAGRDYYVQRSDGDATFKCVEEITDEELVLVARNRKKYKRPLRVPRSLVAKMARAVAKVELIE